jgi:hypothetical protein
MHPVRFPKRLYQRLQLRHFVECAQQAACMHKEHLRGKQCHPAKKLSPGRQQVSGNSHISVWRRLNMSSVVVLKRHS